MDDAGQLRYRNGSYRVFELDEESRESRFDGARFVVMTEAGSRLRHELTLEDARRWVDGREEDVADREPVRSRARRR